MLRPAPESLQNSIDIVDRECAIEPPKAYVVDSETPHAYALPACGSIAFTSDALKILTSAEYETIIRHEIAHLAGLLPLRWLQLCHVTIFFPLMSIPH